jgi:hypothetical protein
MGLVSKSKQVQSQELTKQELEFLLAKLRSANYKGDEFEIYFSIVKKVSDSLKLMD